MYATMMPMGNGRSQVQKVSTSKAECEEFAKQLNTAFKSADIFVRQVPDHARTGDFVKDDAVWTTKQVTKAVVIYSEEGNWSYRGAAQRAAELQTKYGDGAVATFRRMPRWGGFKITVKRVQQTLAKVQVRGTCQACGGVQAVDKHGRIVLHGYNRPGWGYVVGRCWCAGKKPAEVDVTETKATIKQLVASAKSIRTQLKADGCVIDERDTLVSTPADREGGPIKYTSEWYDEYKTYMERHRMAKGNEAHSEYLAKHVLPRFGQDLYEVLK